MRFFRSIKHEYEAGNITKDRAKVVFGWSYSWWWIFAIEPYTVGMEVDDTWEEWKETCERNDVLFDKTALKKYEKVRRARLIYYEGDSLKEAGRQKKV